MSYEYVQIYKGSKNLAKKLKTTITLYKYQYKYKYLVMSLYVHNLVDNRIFWKVPYSLWRT